VRPDFRRPQVGGRAVEDQRAAKINVGGNHRVGTAARFAARGSARVRET
jgi:hypothetical protein